MGQGEFEFLRRHGGAGSIFKKSGEPGQVNDCELKFQTKTKTENHFNQVVIN